MDESLHELLKDIATSLRRIATALEAPHLTARPAEELELNGRQTPPGPSIAPGEPSHDKTDQDLGDEVDTHDRRDILRGFLSDRGIKIKSERERDDADEVLDRLAVLMGSRFRHVRTFYERLKSAMSAGRSFTLNLRNESKEVVSSTCQLATELHRIAFLEEYRYRKSPQYLLYARPSRLPRALNFLAGGWLERYAVAQAVDAARTCNPSVRCSYLKNPQIILPNGDDFELDVLFEAEGEIYWMELKTGEYQRHIAKYSRMSRLLGLNRNRCYMVLTDLPSASAASLSALFRMTVVPLEDLGSQLARAMATHLHVPDAG